MSLSRHRPVQSRFDAQDAGAAVRPISKPESRVGDRYVGFWAPIEYLPDDE